MERLPRALFAGSAPEVAPQLLNKVLSVGPCTGRIVEVEAYTRDDPASHSFRGPTNRNAVMFGEPGRLYVYLVYGMHHCANVVTGAVGDGQAILLRAVVPINGIVLMAQRRGGSAKLADGPGMLCQAFGIDRALDGIDLCGPDQDRVSIWDDGVAPPSAPQVSGRVGISRGVETPWRFRVPSA